MSYKNETKLKRFTSTQNTYSKNSKLSPNLYFKKKMKNKNLQKNVSHTSKKCPLNVRPRKFLKPKTILCKIRLPPTNVFQERSLNPKQFFAKSDCFQEMSLNPNLQEKSLNPSLCKIRPNVRNVQKL